MSTCRSLAPSFSSPLFPFLSFPSPDSLSLSLSLTTYPRLYFAISLLPFFLSLFLPSILVVVVVVYPFFLLPVLEFTHFPATFPALSSPCFLPSQFSVASTSSAVAAAAACAQCADSTVLCSLCCCDSCDLLTIHTTRVCVARLSPVHSLPVHCQCSLMWSQ